MRFRVVSAYHRRGSGGRVEPGAEVELEGYDAERLQRLGCVVPVAISSVAPPLAETLPAPAPDLGDDLAAVVESEPAEPPPRAEDVPVAPSRRRRR